MRGFAQFGLGAGQSRERINQFCRGVDRAALFTVVAILVFGTAPRARALDEAVSEEHAFDRVVELFNVFGINEACGFQAFVNVLRELDIFFAVGRIPVVKLDMETVKIGFAARGNASHKFLRRDAFFLRGDHHRGAVRVIRAHKVHRVAIHSLRAHPDVGLDVFHDVADMEVPVRVGQCGSNEYLAFLHDEMSQ